MEQIHIHTDVKSLMFFSDKNGMCAYSPRAVAYAMQREHIVAVFYDYLKIPPFYEHNKFNKNLPVIYYWDEKRWEHYVNNKQR